MSVKLIEKILAEVEIIKKLVETNNKSGEFSPNDRWMNIDELCDYLPNKLSTATIYRLTHKKKMPYHKNGGLNFLKSEIDNWLKNGR